MAQGITTRVFALHPELRKKYGERGRKKCEEDTVYHLHYLSEALANNSKKMFVNYIGWAKIMLWSRGIDAEGLADNLEAMAQVLRVKSPRNCRSILSRFVHLSSAQFGRLPQTLPSFIDPLNPLAELADSYLKSLLLLNGEDAISLVLRQLKSGLNVTDFFRYLVYPVQQEVGRLWQENQITVVQEHYCTATTDSLINRLTRSFVGVPRSVRALAVCPPGEQHSLGIKMFSELLETDGWKVAYIGPNCPIVDLLKHIRTQAPDLVALSVTTALNLGTTRELITGIRSLSLERTPVIVVGGAVVNSNPELWEQLEADGTARDVSEGVEIANRLVAQRPVRKIST